MKPLYTQQEYDNAKSKDFLLCECYLCQKPFKKYKRYIKSYINGNVVTNPIKYCDSCFKIFQITRQLINCTNCGVEFTKKQKEIKKSKSGNHFCSKSCAATYNNKHKKHGTRRSKLEQWLENKLTNQYPNLEIHFNHKNTIDSELDIYIPSLQLAFELNGIFHYEPIYGKDKLHKIQENDISKSKACIDNKIDLCIIDTSQQKYFKENTSIKYFNIITNIINQRT